MEVFLGAADLLVSSAGEIVGLSSGALVGRPDDLHFLHFHRENILTTNQYSKFSSASGHP
jgi:hypothetical protein